VGPLSSRPKVRILGRKGHVRHEAQYMETVKPIGARQHTDGWCSKAQLSSSSARTPQRFVRKQPREPAAGEEA
jgi:hypothetical protein